MFRTLIVTLIASFSLPAAAGIENVKPCPNPIPSPKQLVCGQLETSQAILSKMQFDGSKYSYEYVAYGVKGEILEQNDFDCDYGTINDNGTTKTYVKSVRFKVEITGIVTNQNPPFTKGGGQFDVKKAIKSCAKRNPRVDEKYVSPVTLLLPQVSTPSN